MTTHVETATGKFVWHEHTSADSERAKTFYTELFGWELETFKPGELDYTMIKANGRTHGGFMEPQGGPPPHWVGYILVGGADETAEKVRAAGGNLIMEPFDVPEVGRLAIIADPQGAVFAIIEPAMSEPDEPPAEGTFVWDELTTTDVEGAKSFYSAVLGWTFRDSDMGGMTYTILQRQGGGDVAGLMARAEGVEAPPHWTVYIATDDADPTVVKAKELGAAVFVEPTDLPGMGRFALLQDPVGAAFGIFAAGSE